MRKETTELVRRSGSADPLETCARAATAARERAASNPAPNGTQRTLELTTRLFTMTEAELHDLTYHAVTSYLTTLRGLTNKQAHTHAGRIAAEALRRGLASDYLHEGVDPRA